MGFSLVSLSGTGRGAVLRLERAKPVTIGRDPSRELPVDDPLCSRLHARVWFDGQAWQVEDCGSRNGTFVNSQRLERTPLEPGDLIRVGDCLMVLLDDSDPRTGSAGAPSLGTSTFVVRVAKPRERAGLVDRLAAEESSRPMRAAAALCRLAGQCLELPEARSLIPVLTSSLTAALQADRVAVYLVGNDGRLRCAGSSPAAETGTGPHLLASMCLEQDEALLVAPDPVPGASGDAGGGGATGSGIAVPIPGRKNRRGAVECHRQAGRSTFEREDLELAIAIVNQAGLALENLEHRERLEQANEQLRQAVSGRSRLIGDSPAMRAIEEQIARAAPTSATVLLLGESGTGKELLAQLIHELSERRSGPCLALNCAAFSESLLESELFGHEKGAFTGADARRAGLFESAHRGTLFLDEIGEMSPACQAKLLRVLEGHPFERVGGREPVRVDVRIVAATHRNLAEMAGQGRFRQDLFYRLRVIELGVPPLRERGEDVLKLAAHFLEEFRRQVGRGPQRLSREAAGALLGHPWPGNVRELKNAIERAVVLGRDEEVRTTDLGLPVVAAEPIAPAALISLAKAERLHIRRVLEQVGGNKTRACEILGIGRGTLYRKIEELEAGPVHQAESPSSRVDSPLEPAAH